MPQHAVKPPRISIITPTLNRAHFLGEAIESVLAQGYPDFEHLVVDGMSSDGTVELLARYPHLRVIREPDSGMYAALNKGLRAATGEIIGHLNSDDLYAPGAFLAVARAFSEPAVEAVCGAVEIFEGDAVAERRILWRYGSDEELALSFHNLTLGAPITNARFFRRSVYDRVGLADESFRISSDREFLLRVALTRPREALVPAVVYRYRVHPGALTFTRSTAHRRREQSEYIAIAERFLAREDLPADARDALERWHENYSVHAALAALARWHWVDAGQIAARACRVRAEWPGALFRGALRSVRARLRGQTPAPERTALEL